MSKLEAVQKRNKELEREQQETSNKYLRLYDENERLLEIIKNKEFHKVMCRINFQEEQRGHSVADTKKDIADLINERE